MTIEIVPSVAVGASQFGPILWTAVAIILTIISVALSDARPYPGLKLVGKEAGEIWNSKAKKRYVEHGVQLMKKAFQDVSRDIVFVVYIRNGLSRYSC